MNNKYYELTSEDTKYILGLYERCIELGLGNVRFEYYAVGSGSEAIEFVLSELASYWQLVVCIEKRVDRSTIIQRDIYRIYDGDIQYDYSESD